MARKREEFYCTMCKKYFLTWLRDDMTGNFIIECPNPPCKHHHFRVIKNGLISEERHGKTDLSSTELLRCLLSTLRDTPWHDDPIFRRSTLKAYNGGVNA